jgi:uncharacterized protein (DUF983 family)
VFQEGEQGDAMTDDYPPQPPISTGLAGRCPRCGEGKLFSGFISVAPRCNACGLDLAFADSADGPAVFIMLIGGFLIVGFALWLEVAYEPAFWVHVVTTLPIALIVSLGLLRPFKGVMIALQYVHKAEEGRRRS